MHVYTPIKAKRGEKLPLSPRQADALRAIREYLRSFGEAPTRAELARRLGLRDHGVATKQVAALRDKGWIRYQPRVARSIVVVG